MPTAPAPPKWEDLSADPRFAKLAPGEQSELLDRWSADVQAHLGDAYDPARATPYIEAQRSAIASRGQSPLSTGLRSMGTSFVQSITGGITGGNLLLRDAAEAIDSATGKPMGVSLGRAFTQALPGGMAAPLVAPTAKTVQQATQTALAPDEKLNPISAVAGSALGQAPVNLAAGVVAGPAGPLALGALQGYESGSETAKTMGVTNPLGRIAAGAAFGGIEAGAERMFGLGSEATRMAADAVLRRLKAKGVATVAGEMVEEPIVGIGQDAVSLATAKATEDPKRPGYTTTGVDMSSLYPNNAEYWNKRKLEAIGGLVGGAAMVGVAKLAGRGDPDAPPPDAPLTEDLGDLRPDEVADLEAPITRAEYAGDMDPSNPVVIEPIQPGATSPLPPQSSSPPSQSAQTPPAPASAPPLPTTTQFPPGSAPAPVRPIPLSASGLVSSGEANTGTQNVQLPPSPLGVGSSPLDVEDPADPASIANIGIRAAVGAGEARRRPVIPDSPMGGLDLLDFLNDNPIGAPTELELSNENWEAQTQIPAPLRKLITDPAGRSPEQVAEDAFNNNLIEAPTPDALIAKINEVSAARESAAALVKGQQQDNQSSERQAKAFANRQQKLGSSTNAQAVPVDDLRPGQTLSIGGTPVTVLRVQTDEEGRNTQVTLDGGKDFGQVVLNNDGNIVLIDPAGTSQTQGKQPQGPSPTPPPLPQASQDDPFSPSRTEQQPESAIQAEMQAMGLPTAPGTYENGAQLAKRALGAIVANKSLPATMRMVARILRGLNLNGLVLRIQSDGSQGFAGQYQAIGNRGEMTMDLRGHAAGQSAAETLIHELLHHATYRALRAPGNLAQSKAIRDLEKLRASLQSRPGFSEWAYQLRSIDEFISGLFTLPNFQLWLSKQPAPEGLGGKAKNALSAIFNSLAKLITGRPVPLGSALDVAFEESLSLVEDAAESQPWENSRAPLASPTRAQHLKAAAKINVSAWGTPQNRTDVRQSVKVSKESIGVSPALDQVLKTGLANIKKIWNFDAPFTAYTFAGEQAEMPRYEAYTGEANRLGEYRFDKDGRSTLAVREGPQAQVTFYHEYGHLIDHKMLGTGMYSASEINKVPAMKEMMAFLNKTQSSIKLEKLRKGERSKKRLEHIAYLQDPSEQFARAFEFATAELLGETPFYADGWQQYVDFTSGEIRAIIAHVNTILDHLRRTPYARSHPSDGQGVSNRLTGLTGPGGSGLLASAALRPDRGAGNAQRPGPAVRGEVAAPLASPTRSTVTPAQDAAHLAAVEAGDMETAQRMVDEAAKAAGYNVGPVKHGTATKFTKFDSKFGGKMTDALSAKSAFFLTDDDKTAMSYAVYAAEDGPVKAALAKAEKAEKRGDWNAYDKYTQEAEELDTYDSRMKLRKNARIIKAYIKGDFLEFDAEGKTPQELHDGDIDAGVFAEIKKAKKQGKTGVVYRNLDDAINLSNRPATHYAVFRPSQIKSADPVTRDESGNVIPLSERFNPESDSILYSPTRPLTARDLSTRWEDYPKARGELTKPKIIKALKEVRNLPVSTRLLAKHVLSYNDAQDLYDHTYYHGTSNFIDGTVRPSITLSDRQAEIRGGGGYGEKYWAISLSKSKRKAEAFSGQQRSVSIHPVLLKKSAKVITLPDVKDSADLDDHILDLWQNQVDAVWIGGGEQELAIINPRAIVFAQDRDTYQVFGGFKSEDFSVEKAQTVIKQAQEILATDEQPTSKLLFSPTRPPPPAGFDYTKARWASPSLDEQLYPIAANEDMRALARDWHMERSLRQAIEELEQETSGLEPAAREMARGFAIRRAAIMRDSTDELEQAIGSSLVHRASRLRNEQRRGAAQELQAGIVTNRELVPFAPVLAAENALIDRADAVMRTRFTGGATAAAAEVQAVATTAGTEASSTVAAILDDATTPPPLPATAEEQARVTELERQLTEARQNLTSQRTAADAFQRILDHLKSAGRDKAKVLTSAKEAVMQRIRMAKAMAQARAAGQAPQQSPTGNTQTAANAAAPDIDPDVLLAVATGALLDNVSLSMFRQVMAAEFGPSIAPQIDALYARGMVEAEKVVEAETKKVKAKRGKATQPKPAKSPNLTKLLNLLRRQTFPGMQWSDIFAELPNEQKTRQRELYQRVKDHPQLGNLTAEQRLELTNQLDKVWQEERSKAAQKVIDRITTPKEPADKAKLKKAMPKMLRWINLGALDAETFRAAVAPQYGIRTMTAAEASRLKAMAEEAYNLPEGVLRGRKLAAMLASMQKTTGLSRRELLNSYWTASVLSGLRTQFVIGMAAFNGFADLGILSAGMALRGRPGVALQAIGAWTRALPGSLADAWQIIGKGDYSLQKRFNEDLKATLEGNNRHWRPVPLGEALWANGGAWSKAPAAVMIFTGRLMAALDHITNTATTEGAKVIARAMHPELYANAAPTAAERTAARQQATNEVTGGAPPNAAEAATIRARTREILAGVMDPDTYQEASFIGDQAAMQNRPAGMMGHVYDIANDLAGNVERKLNNASKNEQALPAARALAALVGGVVRPLTGTQFLRAGFNVGNQFLSYMPGTAVLSLARQKLFADPLSKSQNALLIGRNVVGLAVASAIVAAFVGKDDEEEGWHIEGLQENLSKEQKALRLSVGIKPGSFWKREHGQITSYLYRDNPLAGIFASVGAAQDIYRSDPEQFKREGLLRHIIRGYALGMMQVKEANAMGALMEAIGASSYTADPEDSLMKSITKLPKSFVGGLIPTIIKDAEIWSDPRRFKPDGIFQELLAQVPVLRKTINGGMSALDRLGNDIRQDRAPWSRALVTSPNTPAKTALAKLMAKGLDLPGVGTQKLIRMADGSRVPLETLGHKAVHDYTKAVGKRWQAYLTSADGAELLTMPAERAAKVIRHKDDVFKIQATAEVDR